MIIFHPKLITLKNIIINTKRKKYSTLDYQKPFIYSEERNINIYSKVKEKEV